MNDVSSVPPADGADAQLLVATFMVGEAVFGIDARTIQEVVKVGDLTPVHHAPPYVCGIRNLRGKIITVLDLAIRLELGSVEEGPDNRILIIEWNDEPIGMLVDRMADTIETDRSALAPPPSNLHGVQGENLLGICRSGERLVALLDPARVLKYEVQPGSVTAKEPRDA